MFVLMDEIAPTKGVKYFRLNKRNVKKEKTVMARCLKFILTAKDTNRFISAGTREYGNQRVLYVNYYLRSV